MPQRSSQPYTGRARRKQTAWSVRAADVLSTRLITIGGIGTIVAVCMVFIFLFSVVAPLFSSAKTGTPEAYPAPWVTSGPVRVGVDEYQTMGWALYRCGLVQIFRLDTGETLERRQLFADKRLTAASFTVGADDVALGFDDGSVQFGKIGFSTKFFERGEMPEEIQALHVGGVASFQGGVVKRTPQGQYRLQSLVSQLGPAVRVSGGAVLLLDHVPVSTEGLGGNEYRFAFVSGDEKAHFCTLRAKENLLTGETTLQSDVVDLPIPSQRRRPFKLLLPGRGDNVLLAYEDGHCLRYDIRNLKQVQLAEEVELVSAPGAKLEVMDLILGRGTVVCGDSGGNLRAWFRVRDKSKGTQDGFRLVPVHQLATSQTPFRCLGISERSRMIAVGNADGRLRVYHVTTEHLLLERQISAGEAITNVVMAPKDDGLIATTPSKLWRCTFDPRYPEATVASLFLPVWYEGYAAPIHMWQSSFAGAGPEMKLGLWPLVFGTLKATFYTMLFGAPLALLAAVYTSEFLHRKLRAKVKPAIEMMASLPSVVLGFLAALVFAPFVEKLVPTALACLVTIPLSYLFGAYLWQLLPHRTMLRLERFRLLVLSALLPVGVILAIALGPPAERLFFAGDMMRWLDGQIGSGTGAWLFLWLPLSALLSTAVLTVYVNPRLRQRAHRWSRRQFASVNLAKFVAAVGLTLAIAYAVSLALNGLGIDPRGSYVDTYVQRNALVVGFVMGFAVIPIIYTIADDALSTVPDHLRSASLGCGATPWQTAYRVVIPTAMSGLFSALMIGLGRAVGETMIVLMAGGNTPVTEWNIFNGFRTLSANIAVELPEAVRDSTHYRTLFLAALTLFVLTFLVNTVAEVVRQRFRRRAYQL